MLWSVGRGEPDGSVVVVVVVELQKQEEEMRGGRTVTDYRLQYLIRASGRLPQPLATAQLKASRKMNSVSVSGVHTGPKIGFVLHTGTRC